LKREIDESSEAPSRLFLKIQRSHADDSTLLMR
jgi:hypothetical protein